jgi:hypothetical protein
MQQSTRQPQCLRIPLHNRQGVVIGYTLIDSANHQRLSQWTWRRSQDGYAVRSETIDGKRRTIRLHNEINQPQDGFITDHINGNKLDNRRCNLRTANVSQNNSNSADRNRRSRFRGVYWHNRANKWYAQISENGRNKHLGLFETEEAAAMARDAAAAAFQGQFARMNLPA